MISKIIFNFYNLVYQIEIKDEAYFDIKEAYEYYEFQKKGLGKRFIASLDDCLNKINIFPNHYQIKRPPFREIYLAKFPYAIIFEILNQKIIVFAVFCTFRNPVSKPS